jgi:hypothetical protein
MLTNILIRPAARGGKYLGADAANKENHSAHVSIENLSSRLVVAEGFVNTLNTNPGPPQSIMSPVSRANPFATDPHTVGLVLQVDIDRPTDFRISVRGPLSNPEQARTAQADITVLPGVDIGRNAYSIQDTESSYPEGLVIEIPGLCISGVAADWAGKTVHCFAKVTMMCGCPISNAPNSFWPAIDFSIQLVTYMKSGKVHKYDLAFDTTVGVVSSFTGQWDNKSDENDTVEEAWIGASEPKLGNQGKYQIYLKLLS